MADSTIENLDELAATPTTADLFHIIDDPAGTPTSKKITIDNIMNFAADDVITFTNKTIDQDGTGNNITNIANASIKAAAAIAYSKLNLTGAILNADLAGSITAANLVGTDIVTVGTIATGTWEGDVVASGFLDTDTAHLTTNQVFTGVKTFVGAGDDGKLAVAGTTSGTTIVDATAVASGTLTLPAATDTLVGKDTVDVFTNKSYDLGGTGNVLTGSVAEFNTALQSATFAFIGTANAWGAVDQDIAATGKWQEAGANISPIGIHDVYIPATAMWESTTGGCAAIAKLELATDQDIQTLDFDGAAVEAAQFSFALPKQWNAGTITATFYWSSTATDTGDVDWRLSGVSVGDGIVVTTAYGSAITVTDANQSVANDMLISDATGAITINGAGKSEFMRFLVERDGASDTASEDARLHGIMLHITTDASTAV